MVAGFGYLIQFPFDRLYYFCKYLGLSDEAIIEIEEGIVEGEEHNSVYMSINKAFTL